MYKMFIDDIRTPPNQGWIIARSSDEAFEYIKKNGMPSFISFDHDLGGDDTSMKLLRKLESEFGDNIPFPPDYAVHSANPVGSKNIVSFMESWKRAYMM
jgi:hypothetical protein